MFSLINFTELPIWTNDFKNVFPSFVAIQGFIEFAITGIFALIGGFLADRIGRKKIVMAGFIILGVEYAILSLFGKYAASWYMFTAFDGAAWGLFAAVFFMTLWGDLAGDGRKEKYYILGGLPYLLAGFLTVAIQNITTLTADLTSMSFSFASFFLFVAVLPLVYAPETLPDKAIKDRELKMYLEKAQQIAKKESEKNQRNENSETKDFNDDVKEEKEEKQEDFTEEARKLAEKYY